MTLMGKEQELRLGCQHCSAQFYTVWERAEHERRDHLVIVKQDAPNYGFVSTPTDVPPEQLIHIDSTGRYVLNALGQYVGTLVYETADPARRSSSDEQAEVVAWLHENQNTGTRELRFDDLADLPFNRERWKSTPLYASPSGVKAGVTEAMVEAALAFWCSKLPKAQREQPIPDKLREHMRGTLTAALGVGDEGMGEADNGN